MPTKRTKASSSGLGKAIINRRAKEAHTKPDTTQLYTLDESNPLQSITQERDLDEFLANAALADADFTTERSKLRIVSTPGQTAKNPFLLSKEEEHEVERKKSDLRHDLRVPRRPPWTRRTTRQELERQERDSFLDWRRDLAHLAEGSNLLLTPFERNLQLWRQLWRVLERSHLIVQIVDARNPLGFRCVDLESYVKEIGDDGEDAAVPGKGKRTSLLLVNKADLLTLDQREAWATYFEKEGIRYAFFSASNAAAAQEQADKIRAREEMDESTEGEIEEEDEEEGEGEEWQDTSKFEEGSDVEADTELPSAMENASLDEEEEEEEDWATEDEDDLEDDNPVEKRLSNGEHVPLAEVAKEVKAKAEEVETSRTRVLSVTELEDLFQSAAPPLSDFATSRDPTPQTLMVGLVGYPNVGKSSTINALLGAKKVSVSSTPGKTKHFQTLLLTSHITLCDCPGLVFPQFANTQADMIVDGILPIDQMREYSAPTDLVCRRIPQEILEGTYGIRIDVKGVDEGGSGHVGWEELLSTYAIARGMTRASFGMPDTSRAARVILKDYVNAKVLYAHPPPGIESDDFMRISRQQTLTNLNKGFEEGRKRAPVTHVSKNADTFIPSSSSLSLDTIPTLTVGTSNDGVGSSQRQYTSQQIRANAASAPMRPGREKAQALDGVFFNEAGPSPRAVMVGHQQEKGGQGYVRNTMYPHQRMLGPDGMPLVQSGSSGMSGGKMDKKHFKGREGKKRSGRGYD
ncbi:hypothetical protein TREMEDRAFT_65488 [Tremella mesenterica DSM 1558]|nr:uncharacterized protein TREMEDRAFT_65488 [Tremella mesenterica DSM 1558]EIW66619.1 hypothetical protein TREMEDRAFT_65488 [Tremella mesenterica DSM 1558]